MSQGSWFWKEGGCRNDCSTLDGRMKANAKDAAKREGAERHRLYHCPNWNEVRRRIPEAFRKLKQKGRTTKKERKSQRGFVTHPLSESRWKRGHSE